MNSKVILYTSVVVICLSLASIAYYVFLSTNSVQTVDFDYQQVAAVGEEVRFVNVSSVADPTQEWIWEFGDQSGQVRSLSAKHAFPAPGRFVVSLTLSSSDQPITKQKIIQITQPQVKAAFDIEASSVTVGDTLEISNNSQNASDYVWFLGDGRTVQGTTPVIQYQKKGEYELSLVAINEVGQSSQYALNVSIADNAGTRADAKTNEVIVQHIAIFNERSLSEAFTQLANTEMSRTGKRKIRNDILRDVASINIMVNELSLENYMNKIQLEASPTKVNISISEITRDANNKISGITIN